MTDSMNFGPEWLRNLSSEGSIAAGSTGGIKYQLADYRYGREEMLALFEKGLPPPPSLTNFSTLYSEQQLIPLALLPQTEEERSWQPRPIPPGSLGRSRGMSLERGRARGRGGYQTYVRPGYDGSGGWGNGEHSEWSPRKDYGRTSSVDNWRRNRSGEDDDGWRSRSTNMEKWGRTGSWREGGDNGDDRVGVERMNRGSWQEGHRGPPHRRQWGETEDHLPEWAMENPSESGGTFDATGAFHGSDDEQNKERHPSTKIFKKDTALQKSASENNMFDKTVLNSQPSKSASDHREIITELPEKPKEIVNKKTKELKTNEDKNSDSKKPNESALEPDKDPPKTDKLKLDFKATNTTIPNIMATDLRSSKKVDEDFDRLQEDLVQKLVVEEEIPNKQNTENYGHNIPQAPPNLVPPVQNSWVYQDPQGDLQGPFTSAEMAEWHKAGYFANTLLVKRQCDETFYRLGDLVTLCGENPFLSPKTIPPLKAEVSANVAKQFELLQRQMALNQATAMRTALGQNEFWANLNVLQQRELLTQQLLNQPQITPDLRYLQQTASNPLMQMISQMQQSNTLPGQTMADKPNPPLVPQLDPIQSLLQQIGGSLPNISTGAGCVPGLVPNNGMPPNLHVPPTGLTYPNVSLVAAAAAAATSAISPPSLSGVNLSNLPSATPANLASGAGSANISHGLPPRPNPLGAVDPLSSANSAENDPIKSLLRQLQNSKQQQAVPSHTMDSLWQSNQQFNSKPTVPTQWLHQPANEALPPSLWDMQTSGTVPINSSTFSTPSAPHNVVDDVSKTANKEKEQIEKKKKHKEEEHAKKVKEEMEKTRELEELKKKREADEKKRKEEQKKQEIERKAMEEKRKREEERIKKELEKAKREAEEKRQKELEEKRRLKEQRKAEDEMRKRNEEKRQEEERQRQEIKEREEQLRKQKEEKIRYENSIKVSRAAPWSQPTTATTPGTSLAEIQRLEKEKNKELLQQMQKQQQILQEQQQLSNEKVSSSFMPLNWAKKPPASKKIKSLAEIQIEEQERLAKQAAEIRLSQSKEKETNPPPFVSAPSWKNQNNHSWAIAASQVSFAGSGFWDETSTQKPQNKPSTTNTKGNNSNNQSKQTNNVKQVKSKAKKEEQQVMKLFGNNTLGTSGSNKNKNDEFLDWCKKALHKIETSIDIETFVEFLRNLESALEVRDYCKEYLGDSPSTSQFASQFLEKRRLSKPKTGTQKDDMSSPAPAITPSSHLSDFQEVKGKGKKTKKSKMTKLDKSILGFSVTAATDRINVGDRDYVDP